MDGFHNRILRICLTAQDWAGEDIESEVLECYLGGKGLAAHLLSENSRPGVDPLSPSSPLVVAVGPATGSGLPPSGRHGLFAKSPLTGVFGESYSGGHVACRIASTGYDAIILEGASDYPVWLEISSEGVVFHDATEFWGLDLYETESAVKVKAGFELQNGP